MLQAFGAELLVFRGHRAGGGTGDGDVGREVDLAALQRLGELEADARRGGIVIDFIVENAEAIFGAQIFVNAAHGAIVRCIEAGAIGVQRQPIQRLRVVDRTEEGERRGFLILVVSALISGVSGGDRGLIQAPAIVGIGGGRGPRGTRIIEPGLAVARCCGDDGAKRQERGARIARDHREAITTQISRGSTGKRRAVFPDLFFETNDVGGKIVANIGFLLRKSGCGDEKG